MILAVTAAASASPAPTGSAPLSETALADWLTNANHTLASFPTLIDQLDWRVALAMVPLGIVSLMFGFRIFKAMVIIYSAVAAAVAGWWLVSVYFERPDLAWVGILVGGLAMALVAWPLVEFFVGFWGAMAGGLIGQTVTQAIDNQALMLIGAALGVVLGAILAVAFFRFMIILMTSTVGAYLLCFGVAALFYQIEQVRPDLQGAIRSTPWLLPAALAAVALAGLIYQFYTTSPKGKAPAKEKE